ncbi:MAG: hypothetical protein ABIW47_07215 [Ginsengibacter sp.]
MMRLKWIFILSVCSVLFLSSCNLRKREIELEKKTAQVNEKEQLLFVKEQSLEFREQMLNEREKLLDSTSKKIANDSLYINYPKLPGSWTVKMICTETNCPGSAVGDTKNEQWEISFHDNAIIATAISNNQMVRVYSGHYTGNSIRLTVQKDSADSQTSRMTVRLQNIKEKEMEGEREIIQEGGCRIVYALQLKKQ